MFFCSYFSQNFPLSVIPRITSCHNHSQGRISFGQEKKIKKLKYPQTLLSAGGFRAAMVRAVGLQQAQRSWEGLSFYMPLLSTLLLWSFFLFFCIFLLIFLIHSNCCCYKMLLHFSHTTPFKKAEVRLCRTSFCTIFFLHMCLPNNLKTANKAHDLRNKLVFLP